MALQLMVSQKLFLQAITTTFFWVRLILVQARDVGAYTIFNNSGRVMQRFLPKMSPFVCVTATEA